MGFEDARIPESRNKTSPRLDVGGVDGGVRSRLARPAAPRLPRDLHRLGRLGLGRRLNAPGERALSDRDDGLELLDLPALPVDRLRELGRGRSARDGLEFGIRPDPHPSRREEGPSGLLVDVPRRSALVEGDLPGWPDEFPARGR